jgi:ATP-binding cassette subfamily B protein
VLIIAHRLSTVVAADRTLVLDGGRVVAIGRHAELLETSALYREFASIQLQRLDTLVANEVVGGAGGAH